MKTSHGSRSLLHLKRLKCFKLWWELKHVYEICTCGAKGRTISLSFLFIVSWHLTFSNRFLFSQQIHKKCIDTLYPLLWWVGWSGCVKKTRMDSANMENRNGSVFQTSLSPKMKLDFISGWSNWERGTLHIKEGSLNHWGAGDY